MSRSRQPIGANACVSSVRVSSCARFDPEFIAEAHGCCAKVSRTYHGGRASGT